MEPRRVSWAEVYERLPGAPQGRLFGIPRGGAVVAGLTGRAVDTVAAADWLVDDVAHTSATAEAWSSNTGKRVWSLFDRNRDGFSDTALVMPWERAGDHAAQRTVLERIGVNLLEALGYDPTAEGLRDTPARWARWWQEFHTLDTTSRLDSTFDIADAGGIVLMTGIRLWSVCEHHLLPFCIDVSVGYLPKGHVLGLSKFARLALAVSRRLQIQERLTSEIADATCRLTKSADVAVLVRGKHLCMEARGVKVAGVATSVVTRGAFCEDHDLRAEFIALVELSTRSLSV